MASYEIVNGPSRLDLGVSLLHVGKHGHHEPVVFKLKEPWNSHPGGKEIEVCLTMIEAKDRIFGSWKFRGYVTFLNEMWVEGEYSTHNRKGSIEI